MNCLEFHREKLADPRRLSAEARAHARACANCAAFAPSVAEGAARNDPLYPALPGRRRHGLAYRLRNARRPCDADPGSGKAAARDAIGVGWRLERDGAAGRWRLLRHRHSLCRRDLALRAHPRGAHRLEQEGTILMEHKVKPSPRLEPLAASHSPELKENFEAVAKNLGFVPNSLLIMQRKPKLVKALSQLLGAIWDPQGEVDRGFKRLVAHVASRTAGCQYCMAHTADGALYFGVDEQKLAAVWEFRTSPLFSEGERVALDFAIAAASVPNGVTDDMFAELRKHWNEGQIVEIVGVIATFGFLNRWNDTMGTPLEAEPMAVGERFLAPRGWSAGKHARRA